MLAEVDQSISSQSRHTHAVALLETLHTLRSSIAAEAEETMSRWRPTVRRPMFAPSALNLAQYLAFRRRDLRDMQAALMPLGVSSLGRCESRVMPSIDAVIDALAAIAGREPPSAHLGRSPVRGFFSGDRLIRRRADQIFGHAKTRRTVRIMVTMPIDAVSDAALPRELLERGMDCARINCAHDTPDDWLAIIRNIRIAEQQTGRSCRILMDLSGPRARLGEVLSPNPARRLFPGDRVLLTRDAPADTELYPLQARCMLPEALDQLEIGSRVLIDEGKTISFVEQRLDEGLLLRVVRSGPKGSKLQAEKGLNFPGTSMHLSPLSDKDFADLNFVAQHADMVGYSFVQDIGDVDRLHEELDARTIDRGRPAIVLKVETARAVQNLPELIVRAKGRRPTAVMIARGDLAVELGYERLAEIQEELLWLCEAAHVPVIWATQVLERLVKKGTPSRPEITDAAMSVRAECVMLNKGPCVAQAVSILDDVLSRMQEHQSKKTPQLRALQSWGAAATKTL